MNCYKNIILFICIMFVVSSAACEKRTSEKEPAFTGKELPEFTLKDPRGKIFTKKDIISNGAVIVVTAPILSNKKGQEDWAAYLKSTKKGNGRLVFLQDMSPSSFKGIALKEMKNKSDPGKDPLLLIDPKGEMRSRLGVEKENTIVLVYDKKGKRVHEERGKPSQWGASQIWKSLK